MKPRARQREEDAMDAVYRFMLIVILIVALVFIVTATSYAGDANDAYAWTKTDTALQLAFVGITVVDWCQTLHSVREKGNYEETNPLLGRHPSEGRVNTFIGASIVAHTAVAYLLPREITIYHEKFYPRTLWQSIWIGVEVEAVQQNRSVGLGVHLHF